MTRAKCEAKIAAHVEAIIGILKEYNPECKYLDASYIEQHGHASYYFNNEYWDNDAKRPIHFSKLIREE